tara:strand:+ start:197 stop:397 length:201 start_codon:yes stop_codon:yes gene_type:complete
MTGTQDLLRIKDFEIEALRQDRKDMLQNIAALMQEKKKQAKMIKDLQQRLDVTKEAHFKDWNNINN